MFPGLGGMNPKQMEKMMKQLGIQQEDIDASRVIFELSDGRKWVIEHPSIQKIGMMGKETYQVAGEVQEVEEESPTSFTREDVLLVSQQTGASEEKARQALEQTKDIAEAILKLKK